jgi:hypothetical protein
LGIASTKGGPSLDNLKNLVYTRSTAQLGAYWEGFSGSYLPPPITSTKASQFPVTTKAHVSRYRVRKSLPHNFQKCSFDDALHKIFNK